MPDLTSEYVSGINPCFEVIRAGRRSVDHALFCTSSERNPRLRKLADFAKQRGIRVDWMEKGRMIQLVGTREHQGAALACSPFPYASVDEVLVQPRILLPDNIEDPYNLGAMLRTAVQLGFGGVLLPSRGVPGILPSVVRTSAGACEYLTIAHHQSANQYLRKARENGHSIFALDHRGDTLLRSLPGSVPEKLVLVVGGENRGVGQFILNEADFRVRIEQSGAVNSLNASVSASIAMWALSLPAAPSAEES